MLITIFIIVPLVALAILGLGVAGQHVRDALAPRAWDAWRLKLAGVLFAAYMAAPVYALIVGQ